MTPLIDIIFLLLLFFMLSSTFSKFGEIEIVGASTSALPDTAVTPPAFISLKGEEIAVNGVPMELDGLGAALTQQMETGTRVVLLSVDEATTSQRFVDVYAVTRGLPDLNVAIIR